MVYWLQTMTNEGYSGKGFHSDKVRKSFRLTSLTVDAVLRLVFFATCKGASRLWLQTGEIL